MDGPITGSKLGRFDGKAGKLVSGLLAGAGTGSTTGAVAGAFPGT